MKASNLPVGFCYLPGFVESGRAGALFQSLWDDMDWQQQEIVLFGSKVRQPRLTAWCSDPGVSYRYSGLQLTASTWHPFLDTMRGALSIKLERPFNSVLLNAYRDGRDSMGWHADNETELGPEPLIASVSLGATRRLLIRPAAGGPSQGCNLEDGSLLVMRGRSQAGWRHCVPKVSRPVGPRINLTFRTIY